MKKINIILSLLLCFLLFSCTNSENKKYDINETISKNEEVMCNYNPKNVAVLYPSYSSIWLNSGGSISIGVEDTVNRGFASDINIVGAGTGKDIDFEKLVSFKPDFVILSVDFPNHIELGNKLKKIDIPYGIFSLENFNDYLEILNIFCKINKNDIAYNQYGTKIEDEINNILSITNSKEPNDILLLRASSTKLQAKGSDYFVGEMLKDLNTNNIADLNKSMIDSLSMEYILEKQPKYIFITTMGNEENALKYMNSQFKTDIWMSVDAVKENNYYVLPHNLFQYKPNEKWSDALEYLAKILYKDEFKN